MLTYVCCFVEINTRVLVLVLEVTGSLEVKKIYRYAFFWSFFSPDRSPVADTLVFVVALPICNVST